MADLKIDFDKESEDSARKIPTSPALKQLFRYQCAHFLAKGGADGYENLRTIVIACRGYPIIRDAMEKVLGTEKDTIMLEVISGFTQYHKAMGELRFLIQNAKTESVKTEIERFLRTFMSQIPAIQDSILKAWIAVVKVTDLSGVFIPSDQVLSVLHNKLPYRAQEKGRRKDYFGDKQAMTEGIENKDGL